MSREFDVLVVGAGPAGAMAAKAAAKGGAKTALLERKKDVGIPVRCGEAVGVKGASLSIDIKKEWILAPVPKMDMISPAGHRITLTVKEKDKSFIVDRSIMDADLVESAKDSGACYYNSTNVMNIQKNSEDAYNINTSKGEFNSRVVILAEGVESRLGKTLGWESTLKLEDLETCAFLRVRHPDVKNDTIELYPGSQRAPGGFVWVFPRGNSEANVGLGILGSYSSPGKAKEYINLFIEEKFPKAEVSHFNCGGVPVGKWVNPLCKERVMLVGDAARQVNPLNGGGIAYSLYAGKIAGESAAEAVKKNDFTFLKMYQKRWKAYCGKQQLRQYAMKTLLLKEQNDTFLDRIALSLLKEDQKKLNYFRVFARTFIKHPVMLFKTFMVFR